MHLWPHAVPLIQALIAMAPGVAATAPEASSIPPIRATLSDAAVRLDAGEMPQWLRVADEGSRDGPKQLDLSRFELTFSDDFNVFTASPDGSRGWRTTMDWGNRTLPANKELQYYADLSVGVDPFRQHDGLLDITAWKSANALHLPYVSGVINTLGRFSQIYGYFEIRAKLPEGEGYWPAFWLLPADHTWPPELDVFEQYGKDPRTVVVTSHTNETGSHAFTYHHVSTPDVTEGFHRYGVDWQSDKIRWYLDGVETFSSPTPSDMRKPMYLIANLALSSLPDAAHPSGTLSIDYIRCYRIRNRGKID